MDKLFLLFLVVILAAAVLIVALDSFSGPGRDNGLTSTTVTTTTTETTSTVMQETSTTNPPTTSTVTTTSTTLPQYVELAWSDLSRCRDSAVGKMNTIVAYVKEEDVSGTWGAAPEPRFYYSCDGAGILPFDVALKQGGAAILPYDPLEGVYRLLVKCGRNQLTDDLNDCQSLELYLGVTNAEVNSVGGFAVAAPESTTTSTSSTTTLNVNPYLEKFTGKGYRKVDLKISWLCPSCVPAVNRIVIEEPGVKSRSMSYRQKTSYVIYDPAQVTLEKVMQLAGAGGDITVIEDYEI